MMQHLINRSVRSASCHLSLALALAAACLWLAPALQASGQELKQYESRYYRIHTDLDREVAAEYAAHMDKVFAEYRKRFAGFRPKTNDRMSLYLLADSEGYMRQLASEGIDGNNSGGMFYTRNGRSGLITWTAGRSKAQTISVLQHEGFHQFARIYLGYELPPWANEGLAQYFEDGILIKGKMQLGRVDDRRLALVKNAIESGESMTSLEELIAIDGWAWSDTLRADPKKASFLYAYAWSVAHFLIHADNGRYSRAFGQYLELVAQGHPSVRAFQRAFGSTDLEPMRKRWAAYVTSLEPDELTTAMRRMQMLATGQAWLRKHDRGEPKTLEELREALSKTGFSLSYDMHGQKLTVAGDDEANYSYLDARGKEHPFELVDSGRPGLPPVLIAKHLRPTPVVAWVESEESEGLRHEIEFR